MADMRLDDLITIVVTLAKLVVVVFGVMAVIAFWPRIVSSVSGHWRESIERARAQKARRERLYSWDDYVEDDGIDEDGIGIEPRVPVVVLPAPVAENTSISVPVREPTSRADVLDILARAKVDGKYLFTGNKLADLFTGTPYAASRNTILDEIAAIRNPEKLAVDHRPGAPLKRPANGWH